jgi:hypothetical protein
LRVLRLEVSAWISEIIGKGVWFSIRLSSFILYRNCKRLRGFEEKKYKAVEVTVNSKEESYQVFFVWISAKNLDSGEFAGFGKLLQKGSSFWTYPHIS